MISRTPFAGNVILLPRPHPGQVAVRFQERRHNWLSAGRRWRKTTLVMSIAVERALRGQKVIWGAPTYDQVTVGWEEAEKACGQVARFRQSRMMADFPTGGRITFRSLDDPDNARGHTADGVVIDEAGDVDPVAWYQVLRPMLLDTKGWSWVVGTPRGKNWFYREWARALDLEGSVSWQAPTVGCKVVDGELVREQHPLENPDISFSEVQATFDDLTQEFFEQEILADFIENAGAFFRNIDACMIPPGSDTPLKHLGHRIMMGVDWGRHVDFTVLSVVCADCQREIAFDRFGFLSFAVQRERIKALAQKWDVTCIMPEMNSMGEANAEELKAMGLPVEGFYTTAPTKRQILMRMQVDFEKGRWLWIDHPVAKQELVAFEEMISKSSGTSTYGAPEGLHDDTVMARAIARHAAAVFKPPLQSAGATVDVPKKSYQVERRSRWH